MKSQQKYSFSANKQLIMNFKINITCCCNMMLEHYANTPCKNIMLKHAFNICKNLRKLVACMRLLLGAKYAPFATCHQRKQSSLSQECRSRI